MTRPPVPASDGTGPVTSRKGDVLTLILPLRAKEGLSLPDFYDYWLNAHVTLPPRFPGISSVWLHAVSFDAQTWPRLEGVSPRPAPEDEFHGVPEAAFATDDGLAAFQAASNLQMDDGINFLAEQIAYASLGKNTLTEVDHTEEPAPDGHDSWIRHLLFLRRRPDVSVQELRRFVTQELAPSLASSPDVLKVRRHLFEPVEVTLDHPGVGMWKPEDRQYQAAVEVVVADADSLARLASSDAWTGVAESAASRCEAVHAARVERCITTKYGGQITLAGARGIAAADVIQRLGADNQRQPEVSALFLPAVT